MGFDEAFPFEIPDFVDCIGCSVANEAACSGACIHLALRLASFLRNVCMDDTSEGFD